MTNTNTDSHIGDEIARCYDLWAPDWTLDTDPVVAMLVAPDGTVDVEEIGDAEILGLWDLFSDAALDGSESGELSLGAVGPAIRRHQGGLSSSSRCSAS